MTPETATWQSVCDRYAIELDMAIRECREHNPEDTLITVVLVENQQLRVGTRKDMDGELRALGQARLADHINSCDDVPDGRVVSALVHVIVLPANEAEPTVVGAMPIYVEMKGGCA